jgi:hypothetical protein
MEILTPQRGTSWPILIAAIDIIGKEHAKPFPLEKESSIRPAISSQVKRMYPERVYRAEKETREGVSAIWVWRKS